MSVAKKVDRYIEKYPEKEILLNKLRNILHKTSLQETVKWGIPTYTYQNKNLVGIAAFKNHVGIWFFQGALLKDKYNMLINAQEGKTKAMRQIKFRTIDEIDEIKLSGYIKETIENQKNGLVIKPKKNKDPIIIPNNLIQEFEKINTLEACFNALTLGKQREFTEYIESAKREATKENRLKKIIPLILEKKGLYDKYKNC
jgi:uncharacterized protein YdeI (YjbR/CyaY-like superfamily)